MSLLELRDTGGYRYLDREQCRAAGQSLAERYQSASPFPHIVIDDFLDPDTLREVHRSFPNSEGKKYFDRDQERLKYQYQPHESSAAVVRNLLSELNSQAFLAFLEELTGIEGLIPDPYFEGGGLHEIKAGGHLGVHADFNIHDKMKLERRLNLLIYLNDEWAPEYGGNLELWDKKMQACEVRVPPILGRAVIFSTNLDSYHGHPDALTCPPDRSRRSIATYYYTAFEEGLGAAPHRTTNFRVRPGSHDHTDWQVMRHHVIQDWVPPRLQRLLRRLSSR
jgi:Rps23 Pro-64 3,4-dihydroxylase Tpa1-like proline 4-hydroxylase